MSTPTDYDALLDLEEASRAWVACTRRQQRAEKVGCPHTTMMGGDQDKSCFAKTLDAVLALNDVRRLDYEL